MLAGFAAGGFAAAIGGERGTIGFASSASTMPPTPSAQNPERQPKCCAMYPAKLPPSTMPAFTPIEMKLIARARDSGP